MIATPSNPVNGQTSSYGYQYNGGTTYSNPLEPINTLEGGNTGIRVPYIGYSANSVIYKAEGISNYDALQLQVRKRLSQGLLLTGSYTWSHSLDDQSGEGLFYTGGDTLNLKDGLRLVGFRPDARIPDQRSLRPAEDECGQGPRRGGKRLEPRLARLWRRAASRTACTITPVRWPACTTPATMKSPTRWFRWRRA